jgi:hypothetical protein
VAIENILTGNLIRTYWRMKNILKRVPHLKHFLTRLRNAEYVETRFTTKPIINFGVHLAEHCNLKCWGCDHFAPLAEPELADVDVFAKDFARLSELVGGEAVTIALLGGEPLLHPRTQDFLYIARKHFPKTRIRVVTNGVLLLNQKDDFWKACRQNGIVIDVTKYPINLDFDKMKAVADIHGVTVKFYGNSGTFQKTSYHIPLDLEGTQNGPGNFTKCFHAISCALLSKGRLYTCPMAPSIGHFNKYFDTTLPISAEDSIDIYRAKNAREIFDYLNKPIPFCRYCLVDKRTFGHPWKRSGKDIKEWTV